MLQCKFTVYLYNNVKVKDQGHKKVQIKNDPLPYTRLTPYTRNQTNFHLIEKIFITVLHHFCHDLQVQVTM